MAEFREEIKLLNKLQHIYLYATAFRKKYDRAVMLCKEEIKKLEAKLAQLDNELTSSAGQINLLTSEKASFESKLNELRFEKENAKAEFVEIEGKINSVVSSLADVVKLLTEEEVAHKALQSRMGEYQGIFSDSQLHLEKLEEIKKDHERRQSAGHV